MGDIEVLKPGLFSSIQDKGRFGFREFGVPISGSMDQHSHQMANLILGNKLDSSVLEITQIGPELLFKNDGQICLSGANLSPQINDVSVRNNIPIKIFKNDILKFGKPIEGYRAYLAISGGFQTEKVMNSRSWYEGITSEYRLQKSMNLQFSKLELHNSVKNSAVKIDSFLFTSEIIQVYPGPEFELLSPLQQKLIEGQDFTVGKNANRMAIQLEEKLENNLDSILTGPVIPGTVQLTAGGRLIVLMRDCQTTGGYPRVLQLSENAINQIAQKSPGQKFKFQIKK